MEKRELDQFRAPFNFHFKFFFTYNHTKKFEHFELSCEPLRDSVDISKPLSEWLNSKFPLPLQKNTTTVRPQVLKFDGGLFAQHLSGFYSRQNRFRISTPTNNAFKTFDIAFHWIVNSPHHLAVIQLRIPSDTTLHSLFTVVSYLSSLTVLLFHLY